MSEQIDIERHDQLIAYLRATGRIAPDETPACRTLAGGVSNRAVWVECSGGDAWVLKQALSKLRVKIDWFSDPARVHREALGLKHLAHLAPAGTITPFVFEDESQHLLAMQAVPLPQENWKTMLLAGRLEMGHVEQFATLLGTIHRRAVEQAGSLQSIFDDRSFFESLRLEPYYLYAAEQVPRASDFLRRLVDETRSRRLTLVHGDYSPKNILVRDDRLVLLDHEVIHWGDPAFDVGFALTHLLSKARHLREPRFIDAARRFWDLYLATSSAAASGWDPAIEPMSAQHTLGCMLARVAGRSTLEYLDDDERARQESVVVNAISRERAIAFTVPAVIDLLTNDAIGA